MQQHRFTDAFGSPRWFLLLNSERVEIVRPFAATGMCSSSKVVIDLLVAN
jgi:hypothetical protein